jgi:hypothetical protein
MSPFWACTFKKSKGTPLFSTKIKNRDLVPPPNEKILGMELPVEFFTSYNLNIDILFKKMYF